MAVTGAIVPGSLSSPRRVQTLLAQHDPNGQARALVYRSYDGTLTMGAGAAAVLRRFASGDVKPGPSTLATVMGTMRGLHERCSSMLAGWSSPRRGNARPRGFRRADGLAALRQYARRLAQAMAWGLLPLTVLSPLTALLMAAGVTLRDAAASPRGPGCAVQAGPGHDIVGRDHDLSSLVWLRPQGGRVMARVVEDGEYVCMR